MACFLDRINEISFPTLAEFHKVKTVLADEFRTPLNLKTRNEESTKRKRSPSDSFSEGDKKAGDGLPCKKRLLECTGVSLNVLLEVLLLLCLKKGGFTELSLTMLVSKSRNGSSNDQSAYQQMFRDFILDTTTSTTAPINLFGDIPEQLLNNYGSGFTVSTSTRYFSRYKACKTNDISKRDLQCTLHIFINIGWIRRGGLQNSYIMNDALAKWILEFREKRMVNPTNDPIMPPPPLLVPISNKDINDVIDWLVTKANVQVVLIDDDEKKAVSYILKNYGVKISTELLDFQRYPLYAFPTKAFTESTRRIPTCLNYKVDNSLPS
nr:hypothetical protein [Candidatus Sigynarchaeum springense]